MTTIDFVAQARTIDYARRGVPFDERMGIEQEIFYADLDYRESADGSKFYVTSGTRTIAVFVDWEELATWWVSQRGLFARKLAPLYAMREAVACDSCERTPAVRRVSLPVADFGLVEGFTTGVATFNLCSGCVDVTR